jgi:hypothetical protein
MLVKEKEIMTSRPLPETIEERGNCPEQAPPRAWETPRLSYVGHVAEVLQSGGGKLSPSPNDPGDIRKPPGQG